ncbi:L-type lectin-domain containing receptor kinase IX.1-like [Zingiber officinale]|uniref:Protein kinase domain-containing protein n=1 Tax=Zingiber officinale TaxID=94328 RepID=A0A8J5KJK3_ZINOF|nr:L-type lectin-domain containing receptor kinase IX.1-like [Zingiber officinale]KAG6492106.1 hypothetical protein ZIOFF_047056 [Zingiber officinale]
MSFFSLLTCLAFLSFFLAGIPFASCINFTVYDFGSESAIKISGNINVSGGPLQLTGGQPNAATAYYAHAIPMWSAATNENASFSTYFEFSVSFPGGGGGSAVNSSAIGGFSFFLAPYDSFDHRTSRVNSTSSDRLAVEFNSYRVNSTSNGAAAANNDTLAARISYNATSKSLLVQFEDLIKASPNSMSLNLNRSVDVREVLPEKVLVGFFVTNGSGAALQRITRWDFTSDLEPKRNKSTLELWMVAPVVALILALILAALTYYIRSGRGSLRTKILYFAILSLEKGVTFARRPLLLRRLMGNKVENASLNLTESMDDEFSTGTTGPRRFSYLELALATNNFSEKRKLGEGGFGGVYKGFLCRSGREVAVKKISSQSKQGRKEYESEVKIISRLRHRNLVQLLGWCHERGEFLLVYEFLPNGSLDAHLFGRKTPLPWSIRYKVAAGLAKALLYLHEEWEQCVVHRDIKPSNVILDSGFNAKLGDFGLARLVDHQLGQHATGVAGTLGYLAPECFHTGKASKESDAYSFGMVALEIATGRPAVEHGNVAVAVPVRLVEWVWEMYGKRRLMEAADQRMGSDFKAEEMERLLLVGLWCAHPDQRQRPSMREVVQALRFEGAVIPNLPKKMPVPVFPSLLPPTLSSPSTPPTITFGSFTTGR